MESDRPSHNKRFGFEHRISFSRWYRPTPTCQEKISQIQTLIKETRDQLNQDDIRHILSLLHGSNNEMPPLPPLSTIMSCNNSVTSVHNQVDAKGNSSVGISKMIRCCYQRQHIRTSCKYD